ncbi:MAG: hypothetical protein ACYS3N_02525 [Planctomycetota bacterium]|jgi:hypothetical protein
MQLASRYFTAIETVDTKLYTDLYHPGIVPQMSECLALLCTLEAAECANVISLPDVKTFDYFISWLNSPTLVRSLKDYVGHDAKIWEIEFRCQNASPDIRLFRRHILVQSKDGFHFGLPPDIKTSIQDKLQIARASDSDKLQYAKSLAKSIRDANEIYSWGSVPKDDVRFPIYIPEEKDFGCWVATNRARKQSHPIFRARIDPIVPEVKLDTEKLLFCSSLEEGEEIKRDKYGWHFIKEISLGFTGTVLLYPPNNDHDNDAFISIQNAIERKVVINSILKVGHRIANTAGYYNRDRDSHEIYLDLLVVDLNNLTVQHRKKFNSYPPLKITDSGGIGTKRIGGTDTLADQIYTWLMSLPKR